MRDGDGWYRRPGFWSRRRDAVPLRRRPMRTCRQPAWRNDRSRPPIIPPDKPWPTHQALTIS